MTIPQMDKKLFFRSFLSIGSHIFFVNLEPQLQAVNEDMSRDKLLLDRILGVFCSFVQVFLCAAF